MKPTNAARITNIGSNTLVRNRNGHRDNRTFMGNTLILWQALDPQNEVHFDRAFFRHSDLLDLWRKSLVPRFDAIYPGRNIGDGEPAFGIRCGTIRLFEHEDDAAHVAVDRADHIHPPGLG